MGHSVKKMHNVTLYLVTFAVVATCFYNAAMKFLSQEFRQKYVCSYPSLYAVIISFIMILIDIPWTLNEIATLKFIDIMHEVNDCDGNLQCVDSCFSFSWKTQNGILDSYTAISNLCQF